jgi:hypothetical protein
MAKKHSTLSILNFGIGGIHYVYSLRATPCIDPIYPIIFKNIKKNDQIRSILCKLKLLTTVFSSMHL